MATNLFTVLPGLEVSQDEILQAELIAQKILEAKFPDLDLRQGTGLRDLVIRPSATLLALANKAVSYYFTQNTLAGITDSSSTDIVDGIMSNWFIDRKAGTKSVISARLFFASKKNVSVGTEVFFSPDNTKKFYPITTYSFSPNDLTYDSFSSEYYVDIDLSAEKEGPEYDLTSGSLLYFSNFDPYFLRGEINYLRETSTVTETNSQLIARAKSAVSTRNLINVPSVEARLLQDFDYISSVVTVGCGDTEMYRDEVEVVTPQTTDPVMIHIGGKTDVYVRTPFETQVYQFPTDANGVATLTGPYYSISRSEISGGAVEDTVPFAAPYTVSYPNRTVLAVTAAKTGNLVTLTKANHGVMPGRYVEIIEMTTTGLNGWFLAESVTKDTITVTNSLGTLPASLTDSGFIRITKPLEDTGLTSRQTLLVNLGVENANKTASFSVLAPQGLVGIQSYLEQDTRKVLAGDLLARGFNTYYLDISIVGYNGPPPSSTLCATAVKSYLAGLGPGETFIMADLISALNKSGVVTIKTPINVSYTYYHRDGVPPITGTIGDVLDPKDRTTIFALNTLTTSNEYI